MLCNAKRKQKSQTTYYLDHRAATNLKVSHNEESVLKKQKQKNNEESVLKKQKQKTMRRVYQKNKNKKTMRRVY